MEKELKPRIYEKVNMYHPDKLADRIAAAIVDIAYRVEMNPKCAVEVLLGHGNCKIITESNVDFKVHQNEIFDLVDRIVGEHVMTEIIMAKQDPKLANNQKEEIRCGDNGVFASQWNKDYKQITEYAKAFGDTFKSDGKYIFDFESNACTICQSNAKINEIRDVLKGKGWSIYNATINPLGSWTGGPNVDTGCTNRKLGSDQPYFGPNGLHGKDLSKSDVSVSIYLTSLSHTHDGKFCWAKCSIGDKSVMVCIEGEKPTMVDYGFIIAIAREYINNLGGFEKFAEYGFQF